MGARLTARENAVLYGILADTRENAVLKLDCEGFLLHTSPALEQFGFPLRRDGDPDQFFGSSIADFAAERFRAKIHDALAGALRVPGRVRSVEFQATGKDGKVRWFELQLGALRDSEGQCYGALGILRNIDDRKLVEQRLVESNATDSMTGLLNRAALLARMEKVIEGGISAHLAVFDIDFFRRINMTQGQKAGDRVLQDLALYLQSMLRPADLVARIGGESFAVLLPETSSGEAEAVCRRIVASLDSGDLSGGAADTPVTLSAGLARVHRSIDDTMKRAELALLQAKARGRNRLETEKRLDRAGSA